MTDARFMDLALSLGRRGQGAAWPNPAVGCVVVQQGRIVGRGWTQAQGRPHAEAVALAQAGAAAKGATAFVTLEPCAHVSNRGPDCSGSLIAAGVARVVTALEDPDPRTAGQGHARLRAAGITVETGLRADQARADLAGFLSRITRGRPVVTLKLALTLDGRIATAGGDSKWITGPLARRDVHGLRARHDAVMVGAGTARADNPDLTVRELGVAHQPVRVVMDGRLSAPLQGRLGSSARQVPVWMVLTQAATQSARADWAATGARLIPVEGGDWPDPVAALQALGKAGLTSVLCEGGGVLAASLLQAGLVDRIVTYQAGAVIGSDGRAGVGPLGLTRLADAARFTLTDFRRIGPDLRCDWAGPG